MAKKATVESTEAKQAGAGPVRPSVGRTVHFFDREEIVEARRRDRDPAPVPAIIRRVRNDAGACDLVVFTDLGPRNFDAVLPAETSLPQPNTWSWPARA
jgi:hypothetical protein